MKTLIYTALILAALSTGLKMARENTAKTIQKAQAEHQAHVEAVLAQIE